MGCVRLLFEQSACQSTARTAPVGPVCCTAAKTVPSRLSLISLRFFGSDGGLSPLSWAAAADYVEILCSRDEPREGRFYAAAADRMVFFKDALCAGRSGGFGDYG